MLINYPRCAPRANYTCHLSIPQYISNRDRGFDWFREGSKRTPTVRVARVQIPQNHPGVEGDVPDGRGDGRDAIQEVVTY